MQRGRPDLSSALMTVVRMPSLRRGQRNSDRWQSISEDFRVSYLIDIEYSSIRVFTGEPHDLEWSENRLPE